MFQSALQSIQTGDAPVSGSQIRTDQSLCVCVCVCFNRPYRAYRQGSRPCRAQKSGQDKAREQTRACVCLCVCVAQHTCPGPMPGSGLITPGCADAGGGGPLAMVRAVVGLSLSCFAVLVSRALSSCVCHTHTHTHLSFIFRFRCPYACVSH